MAFVGHPILADIRKGLRLRPTQTVDKSKPVIQAEGEQLHELLQNRAFSSASPLQERDNGVPKVTTANNGVPKVTTANNGVPKVTTANNGVPKVTTAPLLTQQTKDTKRHQMNTPIAKVADHRQKMLAQIRAGGVQLRHVQTVDKSGLILDEQQQQQREIGMRNSAVSPQSLDSQGKSPSPRTTPSSSSATAFSPIPPINGCNGDGICWHRKLSDDSFESTPLANGFASQNLLNYACTNPEDHPHLSTYHAVEHLHQNHHRPADHAPAVDSQHHQRQQQDQQSPPSPLPPHRSPHHPPHISPSPSNMILDSMPCPFSPNQWQGTTIIRVDGTTVTRGTGRTDEQTQPPKWKSDFQFDEQQLIMERQEEVASLCVQGSASAKIVAFRKLQQRHQQTDAVASSYCTLPRKSKTQPKHWQETSSKDGMGILLPTSDTHFAVPSIANRANEWHGGNARRAQPLVANWHDSKWPQAQQQHNHSFHKQHNANTLSNSNLRWHSPSPQRQTDPMPPLLHRSASSSMAHFSLAEPSQPSINFRPFGQRVPGGGAHRQHFERMRERFEDAENRNGAGRSAEMLWKRAAKERKSEAELGGKGRPKAKGGVATVFVNSVSLCPSDGRGQCQKGQPPPLPSSSPPEIRQKMVPSPMTHPSPWLPREIIQLKASTKVGGLRDLQDLDGTQMSVFRGDFKFAIDLDGSRDENRLIRIVRR